MASRAILAARRHSSVNQSQAHLKVIAESLKIELPVQPKIRYPDAAHELAAREVYVESVLRLLREQITGEPVPAEELNQTGVEPLQPEPSPQLELPADEPEDETGDEQQEGDELPPNDPVETGDEEQSPDSEESNDTSEESESDEEASDEPEGDQQSDAEATDDPVIAGKPLSEWAAMSEEDLNKPHRGVNKVVRKKIRDAIEASKK